MMICIFFIMQDLGVCQITEPTFQVCVQFLNSLVCKTSMHVISHPHFEPSDSLYSIKFCVLFLLSHTVFSIFPSYPSGVTDAIILAELYHEVLCFTVRA